VCAKDTSVYVQFVDDDEPKILEERCPLGVVRQDGRPTDGAMYRAASIRRGRRSSAT
jgi:hypothetical protein